MPRLGWVWQRRRGAACGKHTQARPVDDAASLRTGYSVPRIYVKEKSLLLVWGRDFLLLGKEGRTKKMGWF